MCRVDFATIKKLVAQSELQEAARLLADGLADSPRLQPAAVQLQERLTRLHQQELKAIISPAEASLERNKISDALLQLGAQLDLPPDRRELPDHLRQVTDPGERPVWAWVLGTGAVLFLLGVAIYSFWRQSQPFDLRAYVYGPGGESQPVSEGVVKLQMGAYMAEGLWEGKPGQVIFPDIPAAHKNDSIRLFPLQMQQYQRDTQLGYTRADQPIILKLKAAATNWRGRVLRESGEPVAGALVITDEEHQTRTDSLGRFRLLVSKPEGSTVQVRVRVDGQERYNRQRVLSAAKPAELILNPR